MRTSPSPHTHSSLLWHSASLVHTSIRPKTLATSTSLPAAAFHHSHSFRHHSHHSLSHSTHSSHTSHSTHAATHATAHTFTTHATTLAHWTWSTLHTLALALSHLRARHALRLSNTSHVWWHTSSF